MRVLVVPDKFKGSLTAPEAARAMKRGVRRACPGARVEELPLSDGGEGFLEAMAAGLGGRFVRVEGVQDAMGRPRPARLFWHKATAYIGLAEVAGWQGLTRNDVWRATTYGVGQLMRVAAERGAKRIVVGLGGSATNDGGTGLARALGYRFLDRRGRDLPLGGGALGSLWRVLPPEDFPLPEVVAAADVANPLCGPEGASRLFGPQKGATPTQVKALEAGLRRLAARTFPGLAREPGAGAAGGTGFGLMAFAEARIVSGFELVAKALGLARRMQRADWVLTGEGSLDRQTGLGKVPGRVQEMARRLGKPVVALAGRVSEGYSGAAFSLVPGPCGEEEAVMRAGEWLENRAAAVAALFWMGG